MCFGGLAAGAPAQAAIDDGLVLKYSLTEPASSVAEDTSGHGRNGVISGDATSLGSEGLQLGGTDAHVRLPNDVMRGLDSITVSTDVKIAPDQAAPYFIWGLGNTTNGAGNGYLFTTGNSYRTSIASGNWSTEQTTSAGRDLARGAWKTITYTLSGGTAVSLRRRYGSCAQDRRHHHPGKHRGRNDDGELPWQVRLHRRQVPEGAGPRLPHLQPCLSAAEVRELGYVSPEQRVALDLQNLSLGDTSAVTADLKLPTAGPNGSAYTWTSSDPASVSPQGIVARPANGTGNATVTLTATATSGEASASKSFSVTVLEDISGDQKVREASAALNVWDAQRDPRQHHPTHGRACTGPAWIGNREPRIRHHDHRRSHAPGLRQPSGQAQPPRDRQFGKAKSKRTFRVTRPSAAQDRGQRGLRLRVLHRQRHRRGDIFMAASRGNDALKWDELNGGKPVVKSSLGTKGLRDPFVIRSPEGDKFYMIATDLSIGSGTSWDASQRQGSQYLEVWESTDLVNWSGQRHVKVSPDTAGNTWAPEAHYDAKIGAYVVYWASKIYADNDPSHAGGTHNKMMYSTTRDFRTFSEAKVWNDPGDSVIDSTVIKEGDTYYRFTKDEARVSGASTSCRRSPRICWPSICPKRTRATGP